MRFGRACAGIVPERFIFSGPVCPKEDHLRRYGCKGYMKGYMKGLCATAKARRCALQLW